MNCPLDWPTPRAVKGAPAGRDLESCQLGPVLVSSTWLRSGFAAESGDPKLGGVAIDQHSHAAIYSDFTPRVDSRDCCSSTCLSTF